jgi:xylulokinase
MARSVIEGVTYALADAMDLARDLGVEAAAVRTTGGGARSPLWCSIQADILNTRVLRALFDAGPAYGAAILAGAGAGLFASVQDAADRFVRIRDEIAPTAANVDLYRDYHELYDGLYGALRTRYRSLAALVARTAP